VDKPTKKLKFVHEEEISLGVLIHQHVRAAVEQAVHEELAAVLGAELYERSEARRGERNGTKSRTLTGPTGPLELTLPRARLFTPVGSEEWASKLVPALPAARPRSQRVGPGRVPLGRQHEANRGRAAAAAQGGAALEERGLARGRDAQERAGDVGEAIAGGPGRGVPLPRRDRAASADGQARDERPDAGRAGGARRRAEAAGRDGDVRK
jgi:hypothetical protein